MTPLLNWQGQLNKITYMKKLADSLKSSEKLLESNECQLCHFNSLHEDFSSKKRQ